MAGIAGRLAGMKSWDDRAAYMRALNVLKLEADREMNLAQYHGDVEPSALIAAWEKVQVARGKLQSGEDLGMGLAQVVGIPGAAEGT
jgi:hypothetical protein